MNLQEPRKYVVPAHELQTVKGYKTIAHYSLGPATAFLATKDNAKRPTWRVRVTFTDGRDDIVRRFAGWNALDSAKHFARWAVMPILTYEQVQSLL